MLMAVIPTQPPGDDNRRFEFTFVQSGSEGGWWWLLADLGTMGEHAALARSASPLRNRHAFHAFSLNAMHEE